MMIILSAGVVLPPPAIIKPTKLWTGKQLFSIAFPNDLDLDNLSERINLDDFVIRKGYLLSGDFKKNTQEELLTCCLKTFYGNETIMKIVKKMQEISDSFNRHFCRPGITFTAKDWMYKTRRFMRRVRREVTRKTYVTRRWDNFSKNYIRQQILADVTPRLIKGLPSDSSVLAMLKSGSKKRPTKLT